MLDRAARKRAEGRRPYGFSGAKIETSMMPGAANPAIGDNPIDQWSVVVSALSANCEEVIAATDKQHSIRAHVTQELLSVGEFAFRYASREIGAFEFFG